MLICHGEKSNIKNAHCRWGWWSYLPRHSGSPLSGSSSEPSGLTWTRSKPSLNLRSLLVSSTADPYTFEASIQWVSWLTLWRRIIVRFLLINHVLTCHLSHLLKWPWSAVDVNGSCRPDNRKYGHLYNYFLFTLYYLRYIESSEPYFFWIVKHECQIN